MAEEPVVAVESVGGSLCTVCGKRPQCGRAAAGTMCANCYLYDQRVRKKLEEKVAEKAREEKAAVEEGVPQSLLDLRWANEHPEKPTTGTRELLQKMRREKGGEFLDRLERAEAHHAASRKAKDGAPEAQADEGIERALELVDRWLEENEEVGDAG